MFTGIVETTGTVEDNRDGRLEILVSGKFGKGIKIGSSIAVNGACLTLLERKAKSEKRKTVLPFDVIPETLRCTNLSLLKKGDKVNVERTLKAGGRFEGHIVQGHVDKKSKVKSQKSKVNTDGIMERIIQIAMPAWLRKYVVPKGSIAVDGISLTVVDVGKNYFTVAIIPHTWENTIAQYYKRGTMVNIEADILAKYVEGVMRNLSA